MEKISEEIKNIMQKLGEISPDQISAFNRFFANVEVEGALSKKTKELIAVALSVSRHCEHCVSYHVRRALDLGATKEELIEACWMVVLMDGSTALMWIKPVLDLFK